MALASSGLYPLRTSPPPGPLIRSHSRSKTGGIGCLGLLITRRFRSISYPQFLWKDGPLKFYEQGGASYVSTRGKKKVAGVRDLWVASPHLVHPRLRGARLVQVGNQLALLGFAQEVSPQVLAFEDRVRLEHAQVERAALPLA